MCGIAGTVNYNSSTETQQQIMSAIGHRGPDDSGTFQCNNIWMGNTRLAIQDLTNQGHQPMRSADGRFTIVYNGEIFNHWEIRSELEALEVTFTSTSDTETLLQAFIIWGSECLVRLNGIFAFAIYDEGKQELFIARDALGVKPLYYYHHGNQFLFASEIKALIRLPELDYSLNIEVFYHYLSLLYSPDEKTPFQYVQKLMPGHFMVIAKENVQLPVRYYSIPFDGEYDLVATKNDWIKRTDCALNQAVKRQLLSDAPVGFFLSGGLDSSLIAAIAAKQNPAKIPVCFTIRNKEGFQKEGFGDDLAYARLVATKIGAQLVEVSGVLNYGDELDKMIWQLDEPLADPAALLVKKLATAASDLGIKVLLSGAGADDVFSGYRRHQALSYEKITSLVHPKIFKAASKAARFAGRSPIARRLSKLASAKGDIINRRISTHFWQQPAVILNLFLPHVAAKFPRDGAYLPFTSLLREIPLEPSALNQMLYLEMSTFLPHHNLNYTDKMSMAAGVETRVPYLDKDLVAVSCKMPPNFKMRNITTKFILREVAKKYLPQQIIKRKKTGFGAPIRSLILGDLKPLISERLLNGNLDQWNIFNLSAISQLIKDNEQGKIDGAYTLFSLLCIESWLRQFAN